MLGILYFFFKYLHGDFTFYLIHVIRTSSSYKHPLHYVIKNTPFCVRLSVAGTRINFTNSSLHCSLLYDFDHLDDLKPVDAVKGQSLDYVMQPDASGISFCYPNQVDRPARWSSRSDDVTHKVM